MTEKLIEIPSVLSFQRAFVISDAALYSLFESGKRAPIKVVRHGIRGIQAETKNNKDKISNVQQTESAKTHSQAIGVCASFTLKTILAKDLLFNSAEDKKTAKTKGSESSYRQAINNFVNHWFNLDGADFNEASVEFKEICYRYARNILNGRWLWRNLHLGQTSITVTLPTPLQEAIGLDDPILSAKTTSDKFHFAKDPVNEQDTFYSEQEKALGQAIAISLMRGSFEPIHIEGRIEFGDKGTVEVFPSQNLILNKPDGFARSLYQINLPSFDEMKQATNDGRFGQVPLGDAALRDQKVSNAIRTIDTWYDRFEENDSTPIAVEPFGESLAFNERFRSKENTKSKNAQQLLKEIDNIRQKPDYFNEDAAFLMAILMRGGVYSESKGKKDEGK